MQETEFQFAGAQGTELPARLWLRTGSHASCCRSATV